MSVGLVIANLLQVPTASLSTAEQWHVPRSVNVYAGHTRRIHYLPEGASINTFSPFTLPSTSQFPTVGSTPNSTEQKLCKNNSLP